MSDNEKIDITTCFADDSGNFWDNLCYWNDYNIYYGLYTSSCLSDPDGHSNTLYNFHKKFWNNQRKNMKSELPKIEENPNKLRLPEIKQNSHELKQDDANFKLGSDSIISIYFHWWDMQSLLPKIADYSEDGKNLMESEIKKLEKELVDQKIKNDSYNKWDNIKKFFWCYLHKTNTSGGFIVFPKHDKPTVNTARGGGAANFRDRFDLAMECIRRYYEYLETGNEKDNPLFDALNKDEAFFEMFGSFKNYIDFFCLQDWVNDNYEVLDLLGDTVTTLLDADKVWKENKIIPCYFETDDETKVKKWWNLYHNLMYRLEKRNERIAGIPVNNK